MLAAFIILAVVAVVGYIEIQKKAQAQVQALSSAQPFQETLAVAQTLTALPLPTLISHLDRFCYQYWPAHRHIYHHPNFYSHSCVITHPDTASLQSGGTGGWFVRT